MSISFTIERTEGDARQGKLQTARGLVETPAFMPVGTRGSVKGIDTERLAEAGAQMMLVNTYHLWLRPGPKLVEELGGIHRFAAWDGPILSDSGGFQVFSLQNIRQINDEGVEFQSHLDGQKLFLTPEKSIEIQQTLGVDIAMVLDECPPHDLSLPETERSLALTHAWAKRSLAARTRPEMSVFGITQGGLHHRLRSQSADFLGEEDFDGCAIGGLSVGEHKDDMYAVLEYHPRQLPEEKVRYLMGVGTPGDIAEAVYRGVDLFDCVMPTRSGRFGRAFVSGDEPYLNIKNARWKGESGPLDPACDCFACRRYSAGYVHHLLKVGEMLGPQLLSLHNLSYYFAFLRSIRSAIAQGDFGLFYAQEKKRWEGVSIGAKHEQKRK